MARILPTNLGPSPEPALALLEATLATLPEEWTLVPDRRNGAGCTLLHPDIGIALVDVAPARPQDAVAPLQELMAQDGIGDADDSLPVVAVAVPVQDIGAVGGCLAAAFAAAQPCRVADEAWPERVLNLLLSAEDAAMAPLARREAATLPPSPPEVEPLAAGEPALPSAPRRRRPGLAAVLAVLAGAAAVSGMAATLLLSRVPDRAVVADVRLAPPPPSKLPTAPTPSPSASATLPPSSPTPPPPTAPPASPVATAPPPAPAAPPVTPPQSGAVAALPPDRPAPPAPLPQQTVPARPEPTPAVTPPPAKPAPRTPRVTAAKPARKEATLEPAARSPATAPALALRPAPERPAGPPIDAADLPPLNDTPPPPPALQPPVEMATGLPTGAPVPLPSPYSGLPASGQPIMLLPPVSAPVAMPPAPALGAPGRR